MAQNIRFTKMHGAGNDYIYIDTFLYDIPEPSEFAKHWSNRHTGIGSDGLVLIGKPTKDDADYRMRIFNADGSEAMMCGNASRCIGKYIFEKGLIKKTEIRLETLSGIKVLKLHLNDVNRQLVDAVTVDMLSPTFDEPSQFTGDVPKLDAFDLMITDANVARPTFVSMGNPHFVIFVDTQEDSASGQVLSDELLMLIGKQLENDAAFPERCNIEFASLTAENHLRTRVWERGSGITMACGTGACATAVASCINGLTDRQKPIEIEMDGGKLVIEWSDDDHVYLTGPASFSFEGEIIQKQWHE